MTDHVPYLDLTPEAKEQLHQWLTDHRVDYRRVPVHAQFERDPDTDEWIIPLYVVNADGRMVLTADRADVRRTMVRRRELRPASSPHCSCWPART